MAKRKFSKDLLREWGLPWDVYGTPVTRDEVIDSGRWHEHHEVVFMAPDDGKTWRVGYSAGLTEIQEMQPWDDEDTHVDLDGMVEGVQVEPYERVVIDYKEVE
jgi:hypothetical protein